MFGLSLATGEESMEEQQVFEFSVVHNQLIGALASKMKWVAYFLFVAGALFIVGTVLAFQEVGVGGAFQAVIMIVIGVWTKRASDAFGLIVDTAGRDIMNLMDALHELKRLYTLQFWLFIIAIALIGVGVIFGIMAAM
jgi:hypothetical protein